MLNVVYVFQNAQCVQLDNRGHYLVISDDSEVNIPAIAAAHVTTAFEARDLDQLSLEVTSIPHFLSLLHYWRVENKCSMNE